MRFRTLDDADVKGKRVLVRVDLNVPMQNGEVTDVTRIERQAPTITEARRQGRQGDPAVAFRPAERPRSKEVAASRSSPPLARVIGRPIAFAEDCVGADRRSRPWPR